MGCSGEAVAELPSVGAMIYAESVFELAALCPRPALVCDEDLLPFKSASLNLIVSGLALHRVNDLPGALDPDQARARSRRIVHGGGARRRRAHPSCASALLEAEAETQGGASPRVAPFGDVRDYGALLQRAGFALPVADAETLTVLYANPRELMREIRALGGGNVLLARSEGRFRAGRSSAPKRFIASATRAPTERVRATFEIVYLSGWGRPSSSRSSRSAAQRLADALGTTERRGDKAPSRRCQLEHQSRHAGSRAGATQEAMARS